MQIQISPSDKKEKKFKATIDKQRTVYFGSQGASDFTLHKDEARKQRYINRHRKNEDWTDPLTAGFYAKNLLWNKPTIQEWTARWVESSMGCKGVGRFSRAVNRNLPKQIATHASLNMVLL